MKPQTPKHATHRNGHGRPTSVTDTRIALYARVSSEEQSEKGTIQAQLTFLRDWARLYDLPIVGEYTDEGVSGTTPLLDRPGGTRLLTDAQDGYFGAVAIYKVDRFAQSLRVLLDGYNILEQAAVAFKSASVYQSRLIGLFRHQQHRVPPASQGKRCAGACPDQDHLAESFDSQ